MLIRLLDWLAARRLQRLWRQYHPRLDALRRLSRS